jgi:hypothetical protein
VSRDPDGRPGREEAAGKSNSVRRCESWARDSPARTWPRVGTRATRSAGAMGERVGDVRRICRDLILRLLLRYRLVSLSLGFNEGWQFRSAIQEA